MTAEQATELTARLSANWSPPAWTEIKFALYADALRPLPYALTRAHVQQLIDTLDRYQCPVVATVTKPVYAQVRALQDHRAMHQLQIEGPSPDVRQVLRECVLRLTKKAGVAFAAPLLELESPASTMTDQDLQRRRRELRAQRKRIESATR